MHLSRSTAIAFLCLITTIYAADYFPLTVGNIWVYSMTSSGMVGSLRLEVNDKNATGTGTLFQMDVSAEIAGISEGGFEYLVSSGNDIFALDSANEAEPYSKAFEHQPVAGHEWEFEPGVTSKIVYYGEHTVAAGTFDNCYAVVDNDDTTEIYAPDIGLISASSEGIITELVSYNLVPSMVLRRAPGTAADGRTGGTSGVDYAAYSMIDAQGRSVGTAASIGNHRLNHTLAPGVYLRISRNKQGTGRLDLYQRCFPGR